MLLYHFILDQLPLALPDIPTSDYHYFWQLIATVFGALLFWLLKRDLSKRDRREEKMYESINTLKTDVAVLTSDIDGIRKDLDKLIENRE